MDKGRAQGTDGDRLDFEQPVFGVQENRPEVLPVQVAHFPHEVVPEVFNQAQLAAYQIPCLARHTSISLLIREGVHPKAISSRAGHSNISTTMDIYGHLLKRADREAANKLESLFHNE
jgi:site-specific recombinase XerD